MQPSPKSRRPTIDTTKNSNLTSICALTSALIAQDGQDTNSGEPIGRHTKCSDECPYSEDDDSECSSPILGPFSGPWEGVERAEVQQLKRNLKGKSSPAIGILREAQAREALRKHKESKSAPATTRGTALFLETSSSPSSPQTFVTVAQQPEFTRCRTLPQPMSGLLDDFERPVTVAQQPQLTRNTTPPQGASKFPASVQGSLPSVQNLDPNLPVIYARINVLKPLKPETCDADRPKLRRMKRGVSVSRMSM